MRRTSEKHKKWMLHIQNKWPNQKEFNDPLVSSWFEDRALCAFDWQMQSALPSSNLPRQRLAEPYIDYLRGCQLNMLLGEGAVWCLLDADGYLLALDGAIEVKEPLRELGVELGFSFSKSLVGTTAFSMAARTQETALMYCHESYKKALHDYAAVCVPVRNHTGNYFLMVLMDKHHEAGLQSIKPWLERLVQHTSKNLSNVILFESVLDALSEMVCVFNLSGGIRYLNRAARECAKHGMMLINGMETFPIASFFGTSEKETFSVTTSENVITADITRQIIGEHCICFVDIEQTHLRDDDWRRHVMSQLLVKDGYINRVLAQRGKSGLRLFITTEVGSGERYLVDYISRQICNKTLNMLDCLAGFTQRTMNEATKARFVRYLLNANGNMLCLENLELLAPDLQSVLLKILSSGVITDEHGQHKAFSVELIACSSPQYDWDASRLSHLLYLKLSLAQLDLKPLCIDKLRLQKTLSLILEQLSARELVPLSLDSDAQELLMEYHWPGNFLEAFQVLENAALMSNQGLINARDLPERIQNKRTKEYGITDLVEAERNVIANAWKEHGGQVTNVARALGLSRTTLWRKMKKLNLERQDLAESA
ncbi:helix-turn-helix domain-containing protein [Enterovibrio calviensis]|uniref:helix-turn-helix domain-containing protein n=1 Tax=Enterovibrio calviensis TaxID=91359 RepID=UPI000487A5E7|nr:helix-turn-helix domain-containing protein [Enterovibrio calviensis]